MEIKNQLPTTVVQFLPYTPTLDVLKATRPLQLHPRNVRIKYGYAWIILLRDCKLALAEGISLSQATQPIYLLFTPAVVEQIHQLDPQKHETIPAPITWKKENKFPHKSAAIEEYLLRIGRNPPAAT